MRRISRPYRLPPFYVDIKHDISFIKFLKSVYSSYYNILIRETADIFGGHFFLQILVAYSEVLVLLFLSCFLYHLSITGVLCRFSILCGNIISAEYPQVSQFISKSFDWHSIIDSTDINQYKVELKYMQVFQILIFQIKKLQYVSQLLELRS